MRLSLTACDKLRAWRAALVLATALYVLSTTITSSHAQASIDAEAARSFASTIQSYKGDCDDPVTVAVKPAPIKAGVVARVVNLLGGSCFGAAGQNAYLVVKDPSGWRRLLAAEPGFIMVQSSAHAGYADLDMSFPGTCVVRYSWNGKAYVRTGSHNCS